MYKKRSNAQTLKRSNALAVILFMLIFAISVIPSNGQSCNSQFPTDGNNVYIHTGGIAPKTLTVGGNTNCPDPTIQLRYDPNEDSYTGHLSILNDINKNYYSLLPVLSLGDIILQADATANDIILTTRNNNGHLRFATTESSDGTDIERMTITPKGKVGIWNNEPDNLFSVRIPIGMDYYQHQTYPDGFQDIRFNCYQNESSSKNALKNDSTIKSGEKFNLYSGYLNIQSGYSGIIQARNTDGWGSMLLAVTKSQTLPDTDIDFFQHSNIGGDMPKGLMILNFTDINGADYATTGIGSMPEPSTRLRVQAINDNEYMSIIKLSDYDGREMFKVNNNGLVVIGDKRFYPVTGDNPDLEQNMLLSVNGAIVAKEILVSIEETKWADFVFNDNYNLPSLNEVESYIEMNNKLPDIPSADELEEKGLNIAKMQAKLLQKIEELTLYMIQLKKENNKLKERIINLENKR